MPKHRDIALLPWILGGLVLAAGAGAAAASGVDTPVADPASAQPMAPKAAAPAMPAAHPAMPPAASTQATPKPPPTPAATLQAPPAGQAPPQGQAPPPGTVWECVANGERIFSDTRCGAKAMIRPLSETNRMEATAVYPAHFYQSGYPSYYPDDDTAADNPAPVDSASPVYVYRNGLPIDKHRQHGHPEPAHLPAHAPPAAHAPPPHGAPKKN